MRLLYDAGGDEDFIHCPVCGRKEFGYDKIERPTIKVKCLACGAVTTFRKPVRELRSAESRNDSVQSK